MKKLMLLSILCLAFFSINAQTTLAGWNFPNNPDDATVDTYTSVPDNSAVALTCSQTAAFTYSGATTYSARATGWNSGSGSKYWQIEVNTSGYSVLALSSKQRGSSTGPRDFKAQYKIGSNGTWTDITGATSITLADNWTSGVLSSVSLPTECDNQADVFIRWIMTSNTSIGGGTVGSSGASNIDDIVIEGTLANEVLYFRSKQTGNWNTAGTWEMSSDNSTWSDASYVPNYRVKDITVQSGHTVTLTATDTLDQTVVNGTLVYGDYTGNYLNIYNGAGTDLTINGTFQDIGPNSIVWQSNATWTMGSNGTLLRTRSTSSTNWRDKYNGGISNIPATANWIVRKTGSDSPTLAATGGMYYPNLTIENNSGSAWTTGTSSSFTGSSDYPRIKGDLNIGGSGSSTVSFLNENTNSTPVLVEGNLSVQNGSTLRNYGTGFEVHGNLTVNGVISYDTDDSRKLVFSGSSSQTISGSGTLNCFDLIINKSSNHLTLNKAFTIDNQLTLTAGNIITTATYLLTLADNATVSGGSNSSYVSGPMSKTGNDSFTFPLGKSSNYQPLSISAPVQTTDKFTAEYFNSAPSDPDEHDGTIYNISDCEYWQLDRTTGSSNVTVKLGWNSSTCNSATPASMRIARWNTSMWANQGACSYTGNSSAGSITTLNSLSHFGSFTLSNICSLIVAEAGIDTIISPNQSVQLGSSPVSGYTYNWLPAGSLDDASIANPMANPENSTTYYLTVTDENGCTDISRVAVAVFVNDKDTIINGYSMNGTITDTLTGSRNLSPMYVYDRFGNSLLLEDIRVPNHSLPAGIFLLHFMDDPADNPSVADHKGFDPNAADGAGNDRRDVIQQVFIDISQLLTNNWSQGSNPYPNWPNTNNHGLIDIQIRESNFGMPANAAGVASQFYLDPQGKGISYGNVWEYITTGINPYYNLSDTWYSAGGFFHAFMQFKFNDPDNWNYDMHATDLTIPPNTQDFYTTVLHEVIHCLGIASLITVDNGTSPSDKYSFYDTYLETTTGTNMLTFNDNCYDVDFGGIDISGDCNIQFNNNNGFVLPVYSPSTYAPGSSLSHVNCNSNIGYVMEWTPPVTTGYIQRSPHPDEVAVLCNLGYDLTGIYGDFVFWNDMNDATNMSPDIGCRVYNACNNNNIMVAGVNDFGYYNTSNTGGDFEIDLNINTDITINYSELVLNDINANQADGVRCLEIAYPGGTLTQNATDFTYTPPANYAGRAMLKYRPRNANGQLGNITSVFINIIPPDLPACASNFSCGENLVCYGGFEEFFEEGQLREELTFNEFPTSTGNPFHFDSNIENDNTPDYTSHNINFNCGGAPMVGINSHTGNNHIGMVVRTANGINNPEGPAFRLSHPICDGASGFIRFFAIIGNINCNDQYIQARLTNNQPCQNQTLTQCGLIQSTVYSRNITNTAWTEYEIPFQNNSGTSMNYLLLNTSTTGAHEFGNFGYIMIDDVSLTETEETISIVSTVSNITPCIGNNFTIHYQVCYNGTEPITNVLLQYEIPFGIDLVLTGNDFDATGVAVIEPGDWDVNGCVNLTLNLNVNSNAITGVDIINRLITISCSSCINGGAIEDIISPGSNNTLTIISTPTNETCLLQNGSIETTVSGGTTPYNFTWAGPDEFVATTQDIDNLSHGDYFVTATDDNGCYITDQISITSPPLPEADAGEDQIICAGESVILSGSGGTSYAWDHGVTNGVSFAPTATATYTVTVTDANGCTATDDVDVTVNSLPTANAGEDRSICEDESVTLSGSGGTSYEWDNDVIDGVAFVPDVTTIYTVTVTDANECTDTDETTVYVSESLWPYQAESGDVREGGTAIAYDATTNSVYAAGYFTSNIEIGSYQFTSAGDQDAYFVKFDACGNVDWAKNYGNQYSDSIKDIVIDNNGNSIITGVASGSMLLAKYNSSGTLQWSVSGGIYCIGSGVTVDNNDNIYVTGHFVGSSVNFGGGISVSNSGSGTNEIFVVKYNSSGTAQWAVSEGSSAGDVSTDITYCPQTGHLLITGAKDGYIFISKYSSAGSLIASQTYNSSPNLPGKANSIATYYDYTNSTNYIYVAGLNSTGNCRYILLMKANYDLSYSWYKRSGGCTPANSFNSATGLAVDQNGNAYITGYFYCNAAEFPLGGASYSNSGSGSDNFVAKFEPDLGSVLWVEKSGSSDGETCTSITLTNNGVGYVTGSFLNEAILGQYTLYSYYSLDAFIMRFIEESGIGHYKELTLAGQRGNAYQKDQPPVLDKDLGSNLTIYPNPAQDILYIEYKNSGITSIQVALYNVIGDKTINTKSNPGAGFVALDLTGFAPGVYYIRVESFNLVTTKKIIIFGK